MPMQLLNYIVMFFYHLSSLHKEEATEHCCMAMPSCSDTLTLAWWVKSQYTHMQAITG